MAHGETGDRESQRQHVPSLTLTDVSVVSDSHSASSCLAANTRKQFRISQL